MKIEKIIGDGLEYVYCYYRSGDKLLAKSKNKSDWPIKIGKTKTDPINRIKSQYTAAFSDEPIVGLLIKTNNCDLMEHKLHKSLNKKRINFGPGREWFETNLDIIENLHYNMPSKLTGICIGTLDIGNFIRSKRKKLGVSQTQLGKLCNLRQATISNIERGLVNVNIDSYISIFEKLNIEILLRDSDIDND